MIRFAALVMLVSVFSGCSKNEDDKASQSSNSSNASKVYDQLGDSPRLKK